MMSTEDAVVLKADRVTPGSMTTVIVTTYSTIHQRIP